MIKWTGEGNSIMNNLTKILLKQSVIGFKENCYKHNWGGTFNPSQSMITQEEEKSSVAFEQYN